MSFRWCRSGCAGPVAAVCLLAACQPDSVAPVAPRAAHATARAAVDALDRHTAMRRKARISEVEYELQIDLHGGERAFDGDIAIHFVLADASSNLTLDFSGGNVRELRVNGAAVSVNYNGFFITLPAAALRDGPNSVSVSYQHPYSEDGTGLHRFVDPLDGRTYLYTYLWPYYANRLFPAFDQPNIKGRLALTVLAPQDWTVVSTTGGDSRPAADGIRRWEFRTTPTMSTYVFSLHAGPYRVWQDDADGVPIRLMARQSLAKFVAADEWLEVTRRGLAYYGRYFGIPYAFDKYDQLIVPDFNIGAMENIGAVTFTENYVQRQPSDRVQRENRASTILHEMAHMWFGNLVTHDWWNGLWLNESFATQMAAMAMLETTDFDDTWHGFFVNAKRTAYARDSQVTTHPIEMPVASTRDFFTVFDAITYQKGSSVLKQLAHYVGEENYRRGVSAYLKDFSYDTTQLGDFIGHIERASGVDLERWQHDWLNEAGYNTLQVRADCGDGMLDALHILQTAAADHPVLRAHRVEVALHAADGTGTPLAATVIPATVAGADTVVPGAAGLPCPALVNPNYNDWTYAKFAPDDAAVAVLHDAIARLPEPLERSMFLAALYDRALAGRMPIAEYVRQASELARRDGNIRVQQQISATLISAVDLMQRLRPETAEALATLLPALEEMALSQAGSDAGDDLKRIGLNTFLGTVGSERGFDTVERLLDGDERIPGIELSADLRWQLLTVLSAAGRPGAAERLALERQADTSDYGAKRALTAAAAWPELANKTAWLDELQHPDAVTGLARQRAVMAGLFPAGQTDLQLASLDRILDGLPVLAATADPYFLSSYASVLLTPMCREASVARFKAALDRLAGQLDPTSLRFLREAEQADRECLALRDAL